MARSCRDTPPCFVTSDKLPFVLPNAWWHNLFWQLLLLLLLVLLALWCGSKNAKMYKRVLDCFFYLIWFDLIFFGYNLRFKNFRIKQPSILIGTKTKFFELESNLDSILELKNWNQKQTQDFLKIFLGEKKRKKKSREFKGLTNNS